MSKKVKVIISVVMAIILLTVSGAAVALAQDEPAPDTQTGNLLARIANLLGVTEEQLTEVLEQARQEMREDCQATENCTIRQQDENQMREQWQEGREEFTGKRQEMGRGFQNKGVESQNKARYRVSQSVRGQQMISAPGGWN